MAAEKDKAKMEKYVRHMLEGKDLTDENLNQAILLGAEYLEKLARRRGYRQRIMLVCTGLIVLAAIWWFMIRSSS